jgi:lactate dehydrogenase-like 2-hydroxyacid dehydrogenase
VDEREDLIAHLAACEDERMRVVALAAVGWENVDLDRCEGKSVYLDTQLGW